MEARSNNNIRNLNLSIIIILMMQCKHFRSSLPPSLPPSNFCVNQSSSLRFGFILFVDRLIMFWNYHNTPNNDWKTLLMANPSSLLFSNADERRLFILSSQTQRYSFIHSFLCYVKHHIHPSNWNSADSFFN
jgi:hypothetical protein